MARKPDSLSIYDALLAQTELSDPWIHKFGEEPEYLPDYPLLQDLLTVPLSSGKVRETGSFAKGVDAWLAQEFRRAGFNDHEIWPRASVPRVLPRDIAVLLEQLPKGLAADPSAGGGDRCRNSRGREHSRPGLRQAG